MKNRFPDQTHLPALSESKVRHQKPERTSVQTHSDFTDLQVRGPFAHQILVRRDTPIRHSNRENFSYALLIVRQLVSKTLSPWYGLSNSEVKKPFSAPGFWLEFTHPTQWQLCTAHIDTVDMSAHSLTPVLTSTTRTGILRDSLHILYFARKSPQTAGPSPMDSPGTKEQMIQRKIKVRSIRIVYAFYYCLSKSAQNAGPSPMYSPEIKQQIL